MNYRGVLIKSKVNVKWKSRINQILKKGEKYNSLFGRTTFTDKKTNKNAFSLLSIFNLSYKDVRT